MSKPKLFVKIINEKNAFELSPEGIEGDLEIVLVTQTMMESFQVGNGCTFTVTFTDGDKKG